MSLANSTPHHLIADVGYDDDEPETIVLISELGFPICQLEMPAHFATMLVWSFMATEVGDC